MSRSLRSVVLCSALLAGCVLAPSAQAWSPAPGDYETAHGWGALSISAGEGGALDFVIDAMGANEHVCGLDGTIRNGKGYTGEEFGAPCVVTFAPAASGVTVSSDTPEACAQYCGTNATFEGDYLLPPPGCTPMERVQTRNEFKSRFRAKTYRRAHAMLDAFYKQCGDFLNWVETDAVRNDLAASQHYLGHDAECLAMLKNTKGADYPSEAALRAILPRHDFEAYLPVARAIWSTLRLCRGEAAGAP